MPCLDVPPSQHVDLLPYLRLSETCRFWVFMGFSLHDGLNHWPLLRNSIPSPSYSYFLLHHSTRPKKDQEINKEEAVSGFSHGARSPEPESSPGELSALEAGQTHPHFQGQQTCQGAGSA